MNEGPQMEMTRRQILTQQMPHCCNDIAVKKHFPVLQGSATKTKQILNRSGGYFPETSSSLNTGEGRRHRVVLVSTKARQPQPQRQSFLPLWPEHDCFYFLHSELGVQSLRGLHSSIGFTVTFGRLSMVHDMWEEFNKQFKHT